ncbi:MAG: diaminopimelate epimerase [Nitrososphaeraceae archaeon]|nr:diaminopimelate epimerase [Nitrososphaeraceae archaeon]
MENIKFTKMSGAGNDFIVFEKSDLNKIGLSSKIISKLCDRRNGIGADGVIVINKSNSIDFEMLYYNADGSTGSLCANGARCAIKYSVNAGWNSDDVIKFHSNGKEYSGKFINDGNIIFHLNPPSKIKYNFKVKAFNQLINANYADTGSPHVILKVNDILTEPDNPNSYFSDIDLIPVEKIGREIRMLAEFSPHGVNVNFLQKKEKTVNLRTYERGVESETYACGTGAVAAAIIVYVTEKLMPPIEIKVKSNQKLFVNFDVKDNRVTNVTLTGPAELVYSGSIPLSIFE